MMVIAFSVKMGRKRQKYPTSWLDRGVDGILVKKWRTADSNDSQNVKCLVCPVTVKMPFGRLFNIGEGFTAIDKQFNTKTHQKAMEMLGDDEAIDEPQQINIQKSGRTK